MRIVGSISAILCCLGVLFVVCSAIFEEQLGEFDWKRENIGFINKSLLLNSRIVVATEDGVIASLDQASGISTWRVVMPKGSEILKLVEADGKVVSLIRQKQGPAQDSFIVSARCWSAVDGSLIWDVLLSSDEGDVGVTDTIALMYATSTRQITVLYGNTLHMLDLPASTGSVGIPGYWTWSATSEASAAKLGHGAEQREAVVSQSLLLASLVAPTGGGTAHGTRAAVGCFRSADAAEGVCDGPAAVVVVPMGQSAVTLDLFPTDHQLDARHLSAAVASDASIPYEWNDVVFSISATGAQPSMLVLPLQERTAGALELPFPSPTAPLALRTYLSVSADGELRPAAAACGDDRCVSVALHAANADAQSWALESTAKCQGASWNALHLSAYRFYDRAVSSAQCLQLNEGSLKVGAAVVEELPALSLLPKGPLTTGSGLLSGPAAASAVRYAAVLPAEGKKSRPACAPSTLLVLQSGDTVLLSDTACAGSSAAAVQWVRREGLARVQQAVVLTKDPAALEGGGPDGLAGLLHRHSMPALPERLTLQAAKVRRYARNAVTSAQSLAEHVTQTAKELWEAATQGRRPRKTKISSERAVDKLRIFGFDKTAVLLSYSSQLSRSLASPDAEAGAGMKFSQSGLQVILVDVLQGAKRGSKPTERVVQLSLPPSEGDPAVTYVKLVPASSAARRLQGFVVAAEGFEGQGAVEGAMVIVGTAAGRTFLWSVEPAAVLDGTCAAGTAAQLSASPLLPAVTIAGSPGAKIASVSAVAAQVGEQAAAAHSILYENAEGGELVLVAALPETHSGDLGLAQPVYAHSITASSGRVAVYQSGAAAKECTYSTGSEYQQQVAVACLVAHPVSSLGLDPAQETVVDVTYPSALDKIHVRHSILGDDSVLVKYLNPHVALITSVSTGASAARSAASSSAEEQPGEGDQAVTAAAAGAVMFWTLVDTITGKVVLRLHQDSASLPAHSVIVENHLVSTYWNSKAKRTELSSTALYEGVIDNTELTPFASSRARSNSAYLASATASAGSSTKSAYSAVSPIAIQKTFVLPRGVTALQHTVTAHGLSNKNVIMGLQNGQIYSVDMRQIHPRRPFSEPSTAEKTEGLVRYSPFVTLPPPSALTHNYSLARGVEHIVSIPSHLESSSLVLSFGGSPDIHLNRVMPSQDFDLLSSDFNYYLLVGILLALASAVMMLRNMQQRKHLNTVWA